MKKILITILTALTIFAPMQIAKAADERVVAIIDTAIDSSKFPSIVYEACFTGNKSCLNKTNFMEGKGSANSPVWTKSINYNHDIYHGLKMVTASTKTNSNIKIVFIRIANVTTAGGSTNEPTSIINAIDWVSKNATKYSIDAVSISQSSISDNNLLACTTNSTLINAVKTLNIQNIPTFAATGNNGLTDKVAFPSCTSGIVGVGATTIDGTMLEKSTNSGPGLDIVAIGTIKYALDNTYDISGTSVATVVAATKYVGQTNLFDQFVAGMTKFVTTNFVTYPFIK